MNKFFLYGEEDYLLSKEVKRIKNEFIAQHSMYAVEEFSTADNIEDVVNSVFSQGLFDSEKLVIYYGIPEVREDYVEHFQKIILEDDSSNYLYFVNKGAPDKRKKMVKYLLKNCQSKEFKKYEVWDRDKLVSQVQNLVAEDGFKIESKAVEKLIDIAGFDLWLIYENVEKINTAILPRKNVTVDDVQTLASSGEQNIFNFTDFFRQRKRSLIYSFLASIKKQEEVYMLLSMLTKHIRFIMLLKATKANTLEDMASQTGKSTFYLKKIFPDIKLWEFRELRKFLEELHELDFLGKSGKINPLIGLQTILAKL